MAANHEHPHVEILERVMKEGAIQNKALLAMNKALIRDISSKLTVIESRVGLLEGESKRQFDWSIYFRDRVLPQILTVITLAILALVFAPK